MYLLSSEVSIMEGLKFPWQILWNPEMGETYELLVACLAEYNLVFVLVCLPVPSSVVWKALDL